MPNLSNKTTISSQKREVVQHNLIQDGIEAWQRLKTHHSWADWSLVGQALEIGVTECMRAAGTNKPRGRKYNKLFSDWLQQTKLADIDKAARSRLRECMQHREEIEQWHGNLELTDRLKLNHPQPVLRAWKATQKSDEQTKKRKSRIAELEREVQRLTEINHRLQNELMMVQYQSRDAEPHQIADQLVLQLGQDKAKAVIRALAHRVVMAA